MCFSAPASFIAGSVLSAAGVATLTQPKKKSEIPLALIPLFFGVQQLTEGLVWVSLQNGYLRLNLIATYSFSFFAQVFWPIFVPLAVVLVEPLAWRRKVIVVCGGLGEVVGLCLSPQMPFPIHSIAYPIATCGSCLFFRSRQAKNFNIQQ